MNKIISVAILGSTGYVGLELVKLLVHHNNIVIKFLGCENFALNDIRSFDKDIKNDLLPKLDYNNNFDPKDIDLVFLALPHGISHKFVKKLYKKVYIIDLSADFRLDSHETYYSNYSGNHSCPNLLNKFTYGLTEINSNLIKVSNNVAIPGCYPTSILLPLIPLIQKNLIKTENIIIDSKSGYSGAGKKFNISNIQNKFSLNFYNYNTNEHRHICEIKQELKKHTKQKINFSFNPHILPIFRGMMSTIYCDLQDNINVYELEDCLIEYSKNLLFIKFINNDEHIDFFKVQNTNICFIKFFKHSINSKIIIVSYIDNLLKGAAGQAVQCMNLMFNFEENLGFKKLMNE